MTDLNSAYEKASVALKGVDAMDHRLDILARSLLDFRDEISEKIDAMKEAGDKEIEYAGEEARIDDEDAAGIIESTSGASIERAYQLIAEGETEEALAELRDLFPHCGLPDPHTAMRLAASLRKARAA